MDRSGEGQQICRADLANNKELAFTGFTDDMFLEVHVSLRLISTNFPLCFSLF
jgi:hypothetical protein